MKKIIQIRFLLLIITLSLMVGLVSCKKNEDKETVDMDNLGKVWENNLVHNETVVLIDNGTEISGQLLYEPTKIIEVKDYQLEKKYDKTEYEIIGNKIVRTAISSIPFLTLENLKGINMPEDYGFSTYQAKEPGTNIIFTEGVGIVMHQIAVTYEHNGEWTGLKPVHQPQYLEQFLLKLNNKEDIKIVLNGDSISTGANSSSILGIPPFQDDFIGLFKKYLENNYDSNIELYNTSMGGTTSQFGKDNVDTNINNHNPDLVIIGYGMNDGSLGISKSQYRDNIEFMIKSIKARNANADIVVIATMLANPESIQNQGQKEYLEELKSLQELYQIAILDMTSVTEELYKVKRGVDILANNINHPSDFLVRIYAAGLIAVTTGD